RLYCCRPGGAVELQEDGTKARRTLDGWHGKTVGGEDLFSERLSGRLLKVQGFRGTICRVEAEDYLLRKLGDEVSSEVSAAFDAETRMIAAISGLLRLLTWQDFELLVELVFSSSGWKRTGSTGGVQNTVDIELVLPSTQERAFVQVKSRASADQLKDYVERMSDMDGVNRMFFVWHSGNVGQALPHGRVTLIGPAQLARMVLDAGLATWLRQKVS
ncbi:MAG: restriction endonuclease, partial [Paracoccaceae bacterium]